MTTVYGFVFAAILFVIFERKRLQRLMTWWTRRGAARASASVGAPPSVRAQALVEFLDIMLADASAADRNEWVAGALADQPAQGDATLALINSHLRLPALTLRLRVLLALNSNAARSLQTMARDVAAGHGLTDIFNWDHDAPTDNTVIDGIMAFEQWIAPRGYTLLYLESGLDVPTTFMVRESQVPQVLASAERAGLRVLQGQAYRATVEGRAVLEAAARVRRDPVRNALLATQLATAGFFSGLSDKRALALERLVRRTGYAGVFKHDWRAFAADDEELADGSVGPFLSRCATGFEHLQVPPLLGKSRFAEGGTHLLDLATADGGSVVLLAEADGFEHATDLVAARLIVLMNSHLATCGRDDRFYSVYSGNDAEVLLLSPAMLEVIDSLPQLRGEERPHWRIAEA